MLFLPVWIQPHTNPVIASSKVGRIAVLVDFAGVLSTTWTACNEVKAEGKISDSCDMGVGIRAPG
jgi:hypothetical protein